MGPVFRPLATDRRNGLKACTKTVLRSEDAGGDLREGTDSRLIGCHLETLTKSNQEHGAVTYHDGFCFDLC